MESFWTQLGLRVLALLKASLAEVTYMTDALQLYFETATEIICVTVEDLQSCVVGGDSLGESLVVLEAKLYQQRITMAPNSTTVEIAQILQQQDYEKLLELDERLKSPFENPRQQILDIATFDALTNLQNEFYELQKLLREEAIEKGQACEECDFHEVCVTIRKA